MVSPEAMFALIIERSSVSIFPGVTSSHTNEGFFAGADVVLPLCITHGRVSELASKINADYRGARVNLTIYINEAFDWGLAGACMGYTFWTEVGAPRLARGRDLPQPLAAAQVRRRRVGRSWPAVSFCA